MPAPVPSKAKFLIVGGGIIGCSIAYHLAKLGVRDVVLLERKRITSGTTWHAAGLVGSMRATYSQTQMSVYAHHLFRAIEDETGQATGFRQTGGFTLALDADRLELL
jgi:glycine/D-amino acid oxidase-like deaminating enzyme